MFLGTVGQSNQVILRPAARGEHSHEGGVGGLARRGSRELWVEPRDALPSRQTDRPIFDEQASDAGHIAIAGRHGYVHRLQIWRESLNWNLFLCLP